MAVPNKTLKTVAENAKRLLRDAELLTSHDRLPTALSLAILAIEECGKFYLLHWGENEGGTGRNKQQSHRHKQAILGSFYLADAACDAINDYLNAKGLKLSKLDELSEDPGWKDIPREAIESFSRKVMEELSESEILRTLVAQKMADSEHSGFSRSASLGRIDKLKQTGFYVDVDADGHLLSTPNTVSRKIVEEYLAHAKQAIEAVEEAITEF